MRRGPDEDCLAVLPCQHGAGQRVATQRDRARAFTIFQKFLFSTPFIVGSDFFMWVDEPALGISSTFPEDSNYGLVNERDEPYLKLTKAASSLNPRVYRIHSGKVPVGLVLLVVALAGLVGAGIGGYLWVRRTKAPGKPAARAEAKRRRESCELSSRDEECDSCGWYTIKDGRDYCRLNRKYLG